MKIILVIIGAILLLYSIVSVFPYIGDYSIITEYGKGYVWGKVILLFVGIIIIIVGIKKKKKK